MLSPSVLLEKLLPSRAAVKGVSIGAMPLSPFAMQRSSAVPIALKRPIRKVSLDDLATVANSDSTSNFPVLHPRSSSSLSPRSFTVRDAVSDKIPASPICSRHSEGSQWEDSKIRGGQLYESDCNSSSTSLRSQEGDIVGTESKSSQSPQQQQDVAQPVSASKGAQIAAKANKCQMQPQWSFHTMACITDLNDLSLGSDSALEQGLSHTISDSMRDDSMHSQDSGHKTHGGNFFSPKGTLHFVLCCHVLCCS